MADDLVAFLKARLNEDEQVARDPMAEVWTKVESPSIFVMGNDELVCEAAAFADARHIARWDPARVLAEVDAKRRIIAEHQPDEYHRDYCRSCRRDEPGWEDGVPAEWPCLTLRLLALPYADNPGYQQEWAPGA